MIFSVPHSGTRSLQGYLRLPGGSYRHFGIHDEEIAAYRGRVHVPMRDPWEISVSWEARGLSIDEQLASMGLLRDYVSRRPVDFHVMEQLPNLIGEHPEHEAREREWMAKTPRIERLREWLKGDTLWARFYKFGWSA